jgi:hypothetical protein
MLEILIFLDAGQDQGTSQPRIRDRKKIGSGINIPDPQHWYTIINTVSPRDKTKTRNKQNFSRKRILFKIGTAAKETS